MKILVLTPTFLPVMGGAEKGIFEIYRRISGRHDVVILTPEPKAEQRINYQAEELLSFPSRLKIERYRDVFNMKDWPGQGRLKGLIPPFSLAAVPALARTVRAFKPDVVNVYYALPCGLAAAFAERILKIPVLLSLVGRDVPGPQIPPFWAGYARKTARSVSDVTFISRYCRKALFPSDPGIGHIVPFGADTNAFSPPGENLRAERDRLRERHGLPRDAAILFSLQRLDSWKRVDIVIRAMVSIAAKTNAVLLLGGKGPEAPDLRRLAGSLNLSSRVIFTGYISETDLPLYYRAADAFVFHSTYETFGVVLIQAMACGTPVVAADTTAVPELIRHRRTGLCVEPLNPQALADAVLEILDKPEDARKMDQAALALVHDGYDWDGVAGRTLEILGRTVSKKNHCRL